MDALHGSSTVRALLEDRTHRAAYAPVLMDGSGARQVTAAGLLDAAGAWRGALAAAGLGRGARVALVVEDPVALAVAHLGVMAAGRCSVPLDPGAPPPEHARHLARSGALAVASTDRAMLDPPDGQARPATTFLIDEAGRPAAGCRTRARHPDDAHRPDGPGAATLLLTSGSTGRPKGAARRGSPAARRPERR